MDKVSSFLKRIIAWVRSLKSHQFMILLGIVCMLAFMTAGLSVGISMTIFMLVFWLNGFMYSRFAELWDSKVYQAALEEPASEEEHGEPTPEVA